jgi:DNA recombination protein Rad52
MSPSRRFTANERRNPGHSHHGGIRRHLVHRRLFSDEAVLMFTKDQTEALAAPLNKSHVAQRSQAGRQFSYIEGWHAIAEANRIFGFDGWQRQTVEAKCVAERERKVGQGDGWGVTYTAKVRIAVGEIIREGCGAGHGIDRDLGQAHESALKEAETDAMKRALMTFGNQFGLALYDKTQANVVAGYDDYGGNTPEERAANRKANGADAPKTYSRAEKAKNGWLEKYEGLRDDMFATKTMAGYLLFVKQTEVDFKTMPEEYQLKLADDSMEHVEHLKAIEARPQAEARLRA